MCQGDWDFLTPKGLNNIMHLYICVDIHIYICIGRAVDMFGVGYRIICRSSL